MRICFVNFGNLYLSPYIKNYIDNIFNSSFDILVWNRHGIKESIPKGNVIPFDYSISDNKSSKIAKLKAYLKYSRFCNKIIRETKYDVIVVLQAIGAIFLCKTLLSYYKQKYIIDIRDYSIEGIPPLYRIEKVLFKHSLINVISSDGYRQFLPNNYPYLLVHNYYGVDDKYIRKTFNFKIPIRLGYIGLIRFQDQNKKIIKLFANDERFNLSFIGKNACELQSFIEENSVTNVKLIDYFPEEQTLDYYSGIDGILNVYGNHTPLLDFALSNKLYYSAALRIPIIVSKDTYMEKISVSHGFGFVLDFDDKAILDKLVSFYQNLVEDTFIANCDSFIKQVCMDNQSFNLTMRKALNEE